MRVTLILVAGDLFLFFPFFVFLPNEPCEKFFDPREVSETLTLRRVSRDHECCVPRTQVSI